jgi:hypothetical protein
MYRNLVGQYLGKSPHSIYRRNCNNNITMWLKQSKMGGHGLIHPVQRRNIHRAFRYTEINLRLP